MKKLLLFFLSISFLYAQEEKLILSDQAKEMFAKENKTANDAVYKEEIASLQKKDQQATQAASAAAQRGSSDIMIVDPNVVAKDWTDAFKALSELKQNNLTFTLRDQSTITSVSGVEAMPGGYLLLFTLKTVQGIKYRIVKTGDIISLDTR